VAGSTTSYGNGDFDVVLLRFDQNGSLAWSKTWGGPLQDRSHGICVDYPFVYITGDTRSYAVGDEDAFIMKMDVNGENIIPEFTLQTLFVLFTSATLAFVIILRLNRRMEINSDQNGHNNLRIDLSLLRAYANLEP
jgi:hypothetical protein